jgi:hypothetical protein
MLMVDSLRPLPEAFVPAFCLPQTMQTCPNATTWKVCLKSHAQIHKLQFITHYNPTSCTDIKMHLQGTRYGGFLANEPPPLATTTIQHKATEKMVEEFKALRAHANEPLATFLDYITYGYMVCTWMLHVFARFGMLFVNVLFFLLFFRSNKIQTHFQIDNVITVINGTIHGQQSQEIVEKCHPLGLFTALSALSACEDAKELYDHILVDTPIGMWLIWPSFDIIFFLKSFLLLLLMHATHSHALVVVVANFQPPISFLAWSWTTSLSPTLKLFATFCTKHIWRIFMHIVSPLAEPPPRSWARFSR